MIESEYGIREEKTQKCDVFAKGNFRQWRRPTRWADETEYLHLCSPSRSFLLGDLHDPAERPTFSSKSRTRSGKYHPVNVS